MPHWFGIGFSSASNTPSIPTRGTAPSPILTKSRNTSDCPDVGDAAHREKPNMAIKNSENTISIFSLLQALRRRWYIILIPAILFGAGFTWYAKHQPDRYRTQALIAAANLAPPSYLKEVAPEPLNIQDHLWTVREVLFGAAILEAAARKLP